MKNKSKIISTALALALGLSSFAQAKGLIDLLVAPLLLPLYVASHAPLVVPVAVDIATAPRPCAPAVVYTEPQPRRSLCCCMARSTAAPCAPCT